jgi:hypothetical protein
MNLRSAALRKHMSTGFVGTSSSTARGTRPR